VATRFPYPPRGGDRVRIYNVCAELSRHFTLHLLSLASSRERAEAANMDPGIFASITCIKHGWYSKAIGLLYALAHRLPLQVGLYRNPAMARIIKARGKEVNGVLLHLIRGAANIDRDETSNKLFVEFTDAISLNYERAATTSGNPWWLRQIYRFEGRRVSSFESQLLSSCQAAFVVTETDRQHLDRTASGTVSNKLVVAPNGTDSAQFPLIGPTRSRVLAFIGNMRYRPNVEAIKSFALQVLPLLRAQHPEWRVRVIGMIPRRTRAELEAITGLEVTGAVESIAETAKGALCGICPTSQGAGIQNKVLEYLALGLPAVVSPITALGLPPALRERVLVAELANDYVSAIEDLFENTDKAHHLGQMGRDVMIRGHSWEAQLGPMVSCLSQNMT
jgi:glycosyltransferase involved in cell wall biosynthesis